MPSVTASAPGRLDFLGGIADYSGALVLQTPIRARTSVTLQPADAFTLEAAGHDTVQISADTLLATLDGPEAPAMFRLFLQKEAVAAWAHYPLGCWYLFAKAFGWPGGGLRITVRSEVPPGMGVSSSAALEVATLRALAELCHTKFEGTQIAVMAQRCENHIVGAPCGIMDQLASAFGQPGALLPILCRPGEIFPTQELPPGTLAVGWPSGVKHSVSASPYGRVRAAAFMGKTLLEASSGKSLAYASEWPGMKSELAHQILPISMPGTDFLELHGSHGDPLSPIDPHVDYPLRAATLFPIEETLRCRRIVTLLSNKLPDDACQTIGQCLYASDAAYRAMGLGSPKTDAMVDALRDKADAGIHGARVSGGGSGGTVVVYLHESALPALGAVMRELTPDCPELIY